MNDFVARIKDGAISAQKKYGVLSSLTIAQAILETGWGKYSVGNNIFGVKAGAVGRDRRDLQDWRGLRRHGGYG
nr:glucosaminidase [uncultured Clostridium sp.]